MAAGQIDLPVEQGATFSWALTIKADDLPVDITGYSFRGQIRDTYSSGAILASFTFTITDATAGQVSMTMTAAETTAITVDPATSYERTITNATYDVEMVDTAGTVFRILEGTALISPEVTK